jgi:hypothetical protein
VTDTAEIAAIRARHEVREATPIICRGPLISDQACDDRAVLLDALDAANARLAGMRATVAAAAELVETVAEAIGTAGAASQQDGIAAWEIHVETLKFDGMLASYREQFRAALASDPAP